MQKDTIKFNKLKACEVRCKCGHSVTFIRGLDRMICRYCGNYIYKNKEIEFKYKLNERLKRK